MNIKDFSQPTILTGKQYGTTITIELDHSDTSIDEVMDGMLTIVKGLGYLDFTINEWIKDKAKDVYEDEHNIVKNALIAEEVISDDDILDWNEEKPHYDWDEENTNERMDVIGQNGNEGTHYFATDEDIEECELNEAQLRDYKGVYVEKPIYPMHECWCGEQTECDCISQPNDNEFDESIEYDDYGQRIPKDRVTFEWGDEPEDEEDLEDMIWPEPNEKLREAAKQYSEKVKANHTPIKEQKVLGKWQTDNKTKQIVKLDKTKVRKGKIKDLKK